MDVPEQASRLRKLIAFGWLAVLPFAAFPRPLRAQGDASLWGSIKDPSGAGIAGATVKIKNLETGAERELVTDEGGRFSAPCRIIWVGAERAPERSLTIRSQRSPLPRLHLGLPLNFKPPM